MKAGLTIPLLLLAAVTRGQQISPPAIEWQRSLGAHEGDYLNSIQQTRDGGYMLGGSSAWAPGGTGFGGYGDYWIVRLGASGTQLWSRVFGGFRLDSCSTLQETIDGGFIIGGGSQSTTNGNKTTEHFGTTATYDYWVVRLDAAGQKLWEANIGGNYEEFLASLHECSNGGFILVGSSFGMPSGNKIAPQIGGNDCWVVRLNSNGQKLWDKSYGGTSDDFAAGSVMMNDGGIVLVGGSASQPGGNKTSPFYGDDDFWVVRLDADGNKLWDRSYGGTNDDRATCVARMPDGGFVVAGRSSSPPGGNKTSPNYGNADFWLIRLDSAGNKVAERSFGGPLNDQANTIAVTADGGVIVGGQFSSNPPSTPGFGSYDYWVVRLDSDWNKLWEALYGGSHSDVLETLIQTQDGAFMLGGYSWSRIEGNKTVPNLGFSDYWVLKLEPERPQLRLAGLAYGPDGLHLELIGIKNLSYAIEYSADLSLWLPLQTNRMATSGVHEMVDPGMTNAAQRFYRARKVQ